MKAELTVEGFRVTTYFLVHLGEETVCPTCGKPAHKQHVEVSELAVEEKALQVAKKAAPQKDFIGTWRRLKKATQTVLQDVFVHGEVGCRTPECAQERTEKIQERSLAGGITLAR